MRQSCSQSCSFPSSGGEGTSPNRWMATVPMAHANGRCLGGTDHSVTAFTGPCEKNPHLLSVSSFFLGRCFLSFLCLWIRAEFKKSNKGGRYAWHRQQAAPVGRTDHSLMATGPCKTNTHFLGLLSVDGVFHFFLDLWRVFPLFVDGCFSCFFIYGSELIPKKGRATVPMAQATGRSFGGEDHSVMATGPCKTIRHFLGLLSVDGVFFCFFICGLCILVCGWVFFCFFFYG